MDIPSMMMVLLAKMNTIYEKIESAAVRLNIDAVGRWITAEEYKEITGEDYTS